MARGRPTNVAGLKKSQQAAKESRARIVDKFREDTRNTLFDGRQDVSNQRLDKRRLQQKAEDRFIRTKMKDDVEGLEGALQLNTPGGKTLAERRMELARQYGPTLSEIGSDVRFGLTNLAQGFKEKGAPIIQLLRGLYQKGKDFFTVPSGIETVVPQARGDLFEGMPTDSFVGPTFDSQQINNQSLDALPSTLSNEEFDEIYDFLPKRTMLDNLPFKAKPNNINNQTNFENSLVNARADNVGINLLGELQNLQNLAQQYNLNKIQFDPFNPNRIGYKDQFMFNNTPVNYNVGIGDKGIEGGLSFVFKNGGSVDKYNGLGYKLR